MVGKNVLLIEENNTQMKAGDYYEKNSIRNLHFATGNLIIPGSKVARRIILVHIENGIVVEFLKSTKKVQILSL